MYACLFDVFHHATDKRGTLGVTNAVHIALNGVVQKTVKQHRRVMADLDGFAHVTLQVALLMHDFHGTATEHVAGAHHQRVAERGGFFKCLRLGAGGGVGRLAQFKGMQQFLKALTVFCRVNHVRAGANDGHAVGFQIQREF